MTTYYVYDKTTGAQVYAYGAIQVSNTEAYPLDRYDHVAQSQLDPTLPQAGDLATKWLMDIGPFFDRFDTYKLPILASADSTVTAIVKDVQSRKWVDLRRSDVGKAIDALIGKGLCTDQLKAGILGTPVSHMEQVALMVTYGAAINGGN
jgi:hypothetical protein